MSSDRNISVNAYGLRPGNILPQLLRISSPLFQQTMYHLLGHGLFKFSMSTLIDVIHHSNVYISLQ